MLHPATSGLSSQRYLNEHDYDAGKIDGLWGRETRRALRRFQSEHGLVANGLPDVRTLMALGELPRSSGAPERANSAGHEEQDTSGRVICEVSGGGPELRCRQVAGAR